MFSKVSTYHQAFLRAAMGIAALLLFLPSAQAQLLITPEKAMKSAFPKALEIKKENVLLSPEQHALAQKQAQQKIKGRVFTFYRAMKDGRLMGFGGLHTHRVRTKDATAIYFIEPRGRIKGVEIIAFYEPPEFLPSPKWLQRLKGADLIKGLTLGTDMTAITGATLTSQAVTRSARIVLSVWSQTLQKKGRP